MALLNTSAISFFVKNVPCLKNPQIDCFVTYRNIPGYWCQRSGFLETIAVKWINFVLSRKGKALCERPLALHRLQPEKYKQNIDVEPLENFL